MNQDILYSDSLVEISTEMILFRRYYFPLGAKRVRLADIERIIIQKPTFSNGKYRLQGSAGLHTWFAMDLQRPKRGTIFRIMLRNRRLRIGFSVEDEAAVEQILHQKELL
jgi:hypothetical protein